MDNIVRAVDWIRIRNTEVLQKLRLLSMLRRAPAVVPPKWPLGKPYNSVVCHSDTEFFLALSLNLINRLNVC